MRSPFNTLTLALMPVAIVLNVTIGHLVASLKLPLYLDSIGTVLVGVVAGPLAGGLTGLLSNLIWGLITGSIEVLFFAHTALAIGLLAGFFGRLGWLRRFGKTLLAALITGAVAGLLSAPIAAGLFAGMTGGGTDFLVAFFLDLTDDIFTATLLQSFVTELYDKPVSFLLVFLILKNLPRRLLVRFPQGEKSAPPRRTPLVGRVD